MRRSRVIAAIVSALAGMAICAAPAVAGTYTVRSCWGATDQDGWQALPTTPTAYVVTRACPAPAGDITWPLLGFSAQTPSVDAMWPYGTAAANEFTAPPGTRVVGVDATVAVLYPPIPEPYTPIVGGVWDADTLQWAGPQGEFTLAPWWHPVSVHGFSARRIAIGIRCLHASCPTFGLTTNLPPSMLPPAHQWVTAREMTLTLADDDAPAITVTHALPAEWQRGTGEVSIEATASDNVGVSRMWITVDGKQAGAVAAACNLGETNSLTRPCASGPGPIRTSVDLSKLGDGAHQVVISAEDPAKNVAQ